MSGLRIGSLFSGAGMLDEGVRSVIGGTVAWHAEVDSGARKVLDYRYPEVSNLGDVTVVDWAAVEPVDVITGGSPCQDVSHAGKRAGMRAGTRSGLWASMVDAIDIIRPSLVVWENVRGVLSAEADSAMERCAGCMGDGAGQPALRALGRVLGDLAVIGYDTRWCGLRAADVGAPHGRYRVFVVAWPADTASSSRRVSDRDVVRPGRAAVDGGPDAGSGAAADSEHAERPRLRSGQGLPSGHAGEDSAAATDAQPVGSRTRGFTPRRTTRPHCESRGCGNGVPAHADSNALRQQPVTQPRSSGETLTGSVGTAVAWGDYEPAIRRWERVLGRVAPHPTSIGTRGAQQLSARFDEWLMGWPDGWVTDPAIWDSWKPSAARNAQIKLCGNGVVPQQAAQAVRRLLTTAAERAA